MRIPYIQKIDTDASNPWYDTVVKSVKFPENPVLETYYVIKPLDYATILARTVNGSIIILRQYRPAIEGYTLELPSGHVEAGESSDQAIIRELAEETSCIIDKNQLIPLGKLSPDTGRLGNTLWAFFADNVVLKQLPEPDQNEGIEVQLVSTAKLIHMIESGQMNHALDLSVIALAAIQNFINLNRR